MTFHKLKYPLKDWKPAHLEVRSNWKDTYQFLSRLFRGWTSWSAGRTRAMWEKYCQSSFFELFRIPVILCPSQRAHCCLGGEIDSWAANYFSGRQWRTTVGERGGGRRFANRLFGATSFFAIFYEPIFFAIFFMQWFFLQLSSYLSYLILNILSSI